MILSKKHDFPLITVQSFYFLYIFRNTYLFVHGAGRKKKGQYFQNSISYETIDRVWKRT